MELIEGVGNEVLIVVGLLLAFLVIVLAWLSTSVTDIPRHLFVFERNYMHEFILRLTNSRPVLLQTAQIDNLQEEQSHPLEESPSEENRQSNREDSHENGSDEVRNSASDEDSQTPESLADSKTESSPCANELRQRRIQRLTKNIEADQEQPANEDMYRESENLASNTSNERSESQINLITVKLKYLDDRQREIRTLATETIGELKRKYFQGELRENEYIRFVFNGQELLQESQTLQHYNIRHNSVIHCLVSRISNEQQNGNVQEETSIHMGRIMLPFFTLILSVLWYFRFTYRYMFNAFATLTLAFLTLLFIIMVLVSRTSNEEIRNNNRQENANVH